MRDRENAPDKDPRNWWAKSPSFSSVALSPDGQLVALSEGAPTWGLGANAVAVYRISDGTLVGSHSFDPMP